MISGWPVWALLILNGGPILLSFVSLIFTMYLSRRHLDGMMEALDNSRYIHLWGPAWRGQGWVGGIVLIVKIAGMVVFPRANILNGDVDPTDIQNFPPRLKRLLVVFVLIVLTSIVWMVLVCLLLKFE
ncbi:MULTISPECIES: hypothetical protein [unclassified Pseudomonas]|uniref:hypothetical protein n=1 Tax=unclassified Pseudomonas TaxID=196821 RepID=UPI0030D9831B